MPLGATISSFLISFPSVYILISQKAEGAVNRILFVLRQIFIRNNKIPVIPMIISIVVVSPQSQ